MLEACPARGTNKAPWRKAGPSRRHRLRSATGYPARTTGADRAAAAPLTRHLARLRLVHLLRGRRADRLRSVRFGLSHVAKMDAGRHRAGPVRSRPGGSGGADSGRSPGRFRPLGAAGGGHCGRGDQRQRARLCGLADIPGRSLRRGAARRRQLRAGAGHCGDQSRIGRARGRGRAARPQCPLRVHRQRAGGGRDGRLRLLSLGPRRVLRHRPPARARPSRSSCNVGE